MHLCIMKACLCAARQQGLYAQIRLSCKDFQNILWKIVSECPYGWNLWNCKDSASHCRQKDLMQKSNGGKAADERFLFHGTSKKDIDAICQQNFDWRICGLHGTVYGKGCFSPFSNPRLAKKFSVLTAEV